MTSHTTSYINEVQQEFERIVTQKLTDVGLDFKGLDFEADVVKKTVSDSMTDEQISELKSNKAKFAKVCESMKYNSLVSGYAERRKQELADVDLPKDKIVKTVTIELYSMLPAAKNLRMCCINVRDEIISLNYTWFGYMASKKTIVNSCVSYEDKFQSAVCIFCKMWWWYKWPGGRYRTDLSFSVFFRPRIGEEMERDLNEVQYSVRRALLMEAAKQLGCHWAKVKYEDLAKVKLPADKMNSLKAIFGSMYWANLDDHERYIDGTSLVGSELDMYYDDRYNGIENLLIHEMIINESLLSDRDLLNMAELYTIPFEVLKTTLPSAVQHLHDILIREKDKQELFRED